MRRANEAYDAVQYACNGCGLAQTFAEVFRETLDAHDSTPAASTSIRSSGSGSTSSSRSPASRRTCPT